jgi:hypothetical protein
VKVTLPPNSLECPRKAVVPLAVKKTEVGKEAIEVCPSTGRSEETSRASRDICVAVKPVIVVEQQKQVMVPKVQEIPASRGASSNVTLNVVLTSIQKNQVPVLESENSLRSDIRQPSGVEVGR